MRAKLIVFGISILLLAGIITTSCQKQNALEQVKNHEQQFEEDPVTQKILDFKQKIKMIYNTPEYKSSEVIAVDDAIWDIEASLNFTYSHQDNEMNKREVYTNKLQLPTNSDQTMSELDVVNAYQMILETVRGQYDLFEGEKKKILCIEIEKVINNKSTETEVSIRTIIVKKEVLIDPNYEYNWFWGMNYGTCSAPYLNDYDAALILQQNLNVEIPDTITHTENGFCRVYFTDPVTVVLNPKNFPNEENDMEDNYLDYKLYYATSTVEPFDNEAKCLSPDEMVFYHQQITGMLSTCYIGGKERQLYVVRAENIGVDPVETIGHYLDITYGIRHVAYNTCNYPIDPHEDEL